MGAEKPRNRSSAASKAAVPVGRRVRARRTKDRRSGAARRSAQKAALAQKVLLASTPEVDAADCSTRHQLIAPDEPVARHGAQEPEQIEVGNAVISEPELCSSSAVACNSDTSARGEVAGVDIAVDREVQSSSSVCVDTNTIDSSQVANQVELVDDPQETNGRLFKSGNSKRLSGNCRSALRVHFHEDVMVHAITPYAEIYGMHPRLFDFDKGFALVPAKGFRHALAARGHAVLDEENESEESSDSDDDDEEWEEVRIVTEELVVEVPSTAC